MLSTCCRVGELSRARWEDSDLENKKWRIPSENAKNGKEYVIYLSDLAVSQF
jgi:integrase